MTGCAHIDLECFSEANLKKTGVARYAEHESTELLSLAYAFDDGPVHLWLPCKSIPETARKAVLARLDVGAALHVMPECPDDLRKHVESGGQIRAHNLMFERTVLNGTAGKKTKFPPIGVRGHVCTMAKASVAGLPRGLEDAAKALGTYPKQAVGKQDMLACSKPRNKESEPRWTPENDPDRFVRLWLYNLDDVRAERDLDKNLPDLSPGEQAVIELDAEINNRGVAVDLEAIANIQFLVAQRKAELAARCREITNFNPTQTAQLAAWIRANGYAKLANLQADTVNKAQRDPNCPLLIRELLMVYSAHNMKAVSKYAAIQGMVCADGRVRGMFMYYGAKTGRWSSTGVQLQNFARPVIKDCDTAIEACALRDLEWVKFLYPSIEVMKVFASCLRGVLVAAPGHDLISLDYAGIESRFTAWIFNEAWKLRAFEKFDRGEGPDSYKLAAARSFQIHIDDIDDFLRQIGKVLELAFGFEGGVGACITAAATYGIDLKVLADAVWPTIPTEVMEKSEWMWDKFGRGHGLDKRTYLALNSLKELWRIAHPAHKQGWRDMKDAAIAAVQNPGSVYQIPSKLIKFKVEGDWLYMRLPSGRRVAYYKPEIEYADMVCPDCELVPCPKMPKCKTEFCCEVCAGLETVHAVPCRTCNGRRYIDNPSTATLSYLGMDTDTRQWTRTTTYGGELTENAAQAGSSCLLRDGVAALAGVGYRPIMLVHDNDVVEVPEGFGSLEAATTIFTGASKKWAVGLPVAAAGYRAKRFRK